MNNNDFALNTLVPVYIPSGQFACMGSSNPLGRTVSPLNSEFNKHKTIWSSFTLLQKIGCVVGVILLSLGCLISASSLFLPWSIGALVLIGALSLGLIGQTTFFLSSMRY